MRLTLRANVGNRAASTIAATEAAGFLLIAYRRWVAAGTGTRASVVGAAGEARSSADIISAATSSTMTKGSGRVAST